VRETAAWALGQMGAKTVTPALVEALADADREVRKTAAWALGQLEVKPAPAALVKAIGDADPDVRLTAAWALGQIEDPAAVPALTRALKTEKDEKVAQALVRALAEVAELPADTVKALLDSHDAETRQLGVRTLAGRHAPWPWPWPQPRPRPAP
jgi:HEAT repeat protein